MKPTKSDYFWWILWNFIIPGLFCTFLYFRWSLAWKFLLEASLIAKLGILVVMIIFVNIQKDSANKAGQWYILGKNYGNKL